MTIDLRKIKGDDWECRHLFELLAERTPEQSISHREMPTWDEHCDFVRSKPYRAWYLVELSSVVVGTIYLSRQGEIGISIYKAHRRQGHAKQAIKLLMQMHDGTRFLANVNPANYASAALWQDMGFRKIQETFALET